MNVLGMITNAPADRAAARDLVRDSIRDGMRDRVRDSDRDTAPDRETVRDTASRSARSDAAARSRSARRAGKAVDARDEQTGPESRRRVSAEEFSSLLALLAGAGEQVRTDLVQQLPEEGASLIDKLLEEATRAGDAPMPDAPAITAQQAGEALHYGLLKLMPADDTNEPVDLAPLVNEPPADVRPANGLARAASRVSEQASDRSRALEAIARVATAKGTSMEQLLAMGDTRGAAAKQSLDALLDAAGTPAGARIAARQMLAASRRSLLGGDDATLDAMATFETLKARVNKAGDVSVATRDTAGLSLELQGKVQRVVDRMKTEFGHDVTIVETTRSQERQDWLYEQGRTRPGAVVTWTRESAHTRGEAVDVIIDGSYDNPEGFARLQQIAKEEGLRTLGARDPGHLELPRSGGEPTGAPTASSMIATAQRQVRDAQERDARQREANATANANGWSRGGVARVASVAGVAGVASVAQAARDARDGQSVATNGIGATVSAYASARSSDQQTTSGGDSSRGERESASRGLGLGRRASRDDVSGSNASTFAMPNTTNAIRGQDVAVQAPASATGSQQAERVAEIQQRRADAPASPLSRMTLNVEGANGTVEQITVDVRGNTVSTHITTDAETADRLRLRTADLQDALGRQGLEGESVRVSSAARATDSSEAARTIGGERDALRIATTGQTSQDGASANGQQGRTPREWDRQDETRREQAARARDEREQRSRQDADDQQERQRRQTLFTGNA